LEALWHLRGGRCDSGDRPQGSDPHPDAGGRGPKGGEGAPAGACRGAASGVPRHHGTPFSRSTLLRVKHTAAAGGSQPMGSHITHTTPATSHPPPATSHATPRHGRRWGGRGGAPAAGWCGQTKETATPRPGGTLDPTPDADRVRRCAAIPGVACACSGGANRDAIHSGSEVIWGGKRRIF